jgi:NAD(P)-dependent dehydrogenase (short-subunit alcohol dehydrogenase family)
LSDLAGKRALVTGGGTGIGAAIALALAGEGARVTVAGRREGPLREVAEKAGGDWRVADVTDEDAVAALIGEAPVDILVANAGVAETAPLAKTSLEFWRRSMAINLDGAFLCIREALPGMVARGWGRIVTVASVAGQKGFPYCGAYCASKHGLVGLTRAVAAENLTTGVTANALCPGFVASPIVERSVENIMARSGLDEAAALEALSRNNPFGRLVEPDEVAAAAVWLCGPGSAAVSGQTIQIAGGQV